MSNHYWYGLTEQCTLGAFFRLWQEGRITTEAIDYLNSANEYYPTMMRSIRGLIYSFYGDLATKRAPFQTDPAYYGYVIALAFAEDLFCDENPEDFVSRFQHGAFDEIMKRLTDKHGHPFDFYDLCPVGVDGEDFPIKEEVR